MFELPPVNIIFVIGPYFEIVDLTSVILALRDDWMHWWNCWRVI